MRQIYHTLALVFSSFLLAACMDMSESLDGPMVYDDPNNPLYDAYGDPIYFANWQGQWVIVNYWASYCPPCIHEIPELNNFYEANHERAVVLGVNYDFVSFEETRELVEDFDIRYPNTQNDPRAQLGIDYITVVPTTVVINPEGQVVHKLLGEQTQADLERIIGRYEAKPCGPTFDE